MPGTHWKTPRLVVLLGLLIGAAGPLAAQAPAAPAGAVQTPQRGQLEALFVAEGDYVQRGQLLARLASTAGSQFYVCAPRAGRIRFVRLPPGPTLATHTVLAVIQAPAPQLARSP